jgi:hypothetical protein
MKNFLPPSNPVEILLDTDMATDCDDAGALAVLHTLAGAGMVRINAVVINNNDIASLGAVSAINFFYGRGDIPVGIYMGTEIGISSGAFVKELARDTGRYGHPDFSVVKPDSAVDVYRRMLAASDDGKVVIASIGHLNNLHELLFSRPDKFSPLSGIELIKRKVAHIVVMGGDYPEGKEHNFAQRGSHTVTAETVENWPTPILFTGFTIGLALKTGPGLLALPEFHPVRRAYELHPANPLVNGRPSWDQMAVLAAVYGPDCFWELGPVGVNRIASDGSNKWQKESQGTHAYLVEKVEPGKVAAKIESLMLGNIL